MPAAAVAIALAAPVAVTPGSAAAGTNIPPETVPLSVKGPWDKFKDNFKDSFRELQNFRMMGLATAEGIYNEHIAQIYCAMPEHGFQKFGNKQLAGMLSDFMFASRDGFCEASAQEYLSDAYLKVIWAGCVMRFGTDHEKRLLMLANVPGYSNGALPGASYYLGGVYMWPYSTSARKHRWDRHRAADNVMQKAGLGRFVSLSSDPNRIYSNKHLMAAAVRCGVHTSYANNATHYYYSQ